MTLRIKGSVNWGQSFQARQRAPQMGDGRVILSAGQEACGTTENYSTSP